MPVREQGFLRGRRLSARTQHACHAADAGKSREGTEDDSASEVADDRSGAGSGGSAAEIVEPMIFFPSPLVGEGGAKRRMRGLSPRIETPHPASSRSARFSPPSPTRGRGEELTPRC